MKKVCYYLFFLLSISSCGQRSETDSETQKRIDTESQEAKKAIDRNNKEIVKWYKAKRADSIISYMADNVIQFPPNSAPAKGKDSIKKYWEQLFQFGNVDFSLQTQDVKANGPLAIELGKYIFKFIPDQNSPIPAIVDSGNYLVYWKKINGDWKAVWDAPVSTIPLPQK